MGKKLYERFMKINRVEKAIERKGDKLYVKEKDYDNLFNSWIIKKNKN